MGEKWVLNFRYNFFFLIHEFLQFASKTQLLTLCFVGQMIPVAFMPSCIETEGSIPNSHLKGEWEPALLASTLIPWVPTLWVREGLFLYHLPFLKPLLLTQHSADKRTLNCYLLASSRQKGPCTLVGEEARRGVSLWFPVICSALWTCASACPISWKLD